jgi:hypothetical protein
MPSSSPDPRRDELFVVHVQEQRTEALAGHAGAEYLSPPQEREQALQLVEVVLGQKVTVNGERERCWRSAVAGGQRSVTLRRVD